MSSMYDEYEETPAMRVLREKAEADSALIREMRDELAAMRGERQRLEAEKLVEAQGFSPKVLDLLPKDVDPKEWLTANADLFAKPKAATAEEAPPVVEEKPDGVPADEAAAQAAIAASAASSAPVTGLTNLEAQIAAADSPEAVADLLAKELGGKPVQF